MPHEVQPLQSIEAGLRELSDAERAGVFAPTRVDARVLLATPASLSRSIYRLASMAAVVALGAGLWVWYASNHDPGAPATGSILAYASSPCDGSLAGCMTGPRHALGTKCDVFDYDEDGDIDMFDVRAHQLKCQGAT
jgi:hypothetical protein